ncbi:MAG: hypothetical protein JST30_13910 [Armatimonadetes bacterium]|nr:hypothetical protein [Armatimonadota bacterium]
MADGGLFALYKLHLIDSALYEFQQRAKALDVGRDEAAQIKEIESDPDGVLGTARKLSAEMKDAELEQKGLADKVKKFESDLYGGKVVNPREVENLEKEIASLKERSGKIDDRLLELYEEVPPAKAKAEEAERRISALRGTIAEKQSAAKEEHVRLQEAYKREAAKRATAKAAVPGPLFSLYERIREKSDVGMAMVSDDHRCEACGMPVSEKFFDALVHDKVMQCENCRRILFRLQQG